MTSLYDVSLGQMVEFNRVLAAAGLDAEAVQRVIKQPELAKKMMAALTDSGQGGSGQLIHGRFTPPEAQLANVRRWNTERGWGFEEADFANLGEPPAWPDDPLCAVVLVPFLDSVQRTFEELWAVAKAQQPGCWRWDRLQSDPEHLRLLEGQVHTPGLRWVVLDLGANWNKEDGIRPVDVRGQNSVQAEGLAAACQHPEWVRQMDGTKVPYIWLAGYQPSVPGDDPWRNVPMLGWFRDDRAVCLYADWDDSRYWYCAVPVRREL